MCKFEFKTYKQKKETVETFVQKQNRNIVQSNIAKCPT